MVKALQPEARSPELTDDGDLVTDYAYLAGLVELIDDGNVDEARKWHDAVAAAALSDADARAIHAAISRVINSEAPSVPAIPAAIREGSERAPRRVVALFQRVLRHTINPRTKGAFTSGISERAREIHDRFAREQGLELVDNVRCAMLDRSAGAETFAGLRAQLDYVEALTLRRPARQSEVACIRMDTVEPKPIPWLWPGRLVAIGLNIVSGLMGQTKGLFMVDATARITLGSRWPDATGRAPQGSVLWIGNEDDPATVLRPRLDAAGADVSKVHYVQGICTKRSDDDFRPLCIAQDLSKIAAALDRLPDCRMIVMDPMSEFMDADENASKEIRAELMPLVKLAGARGIALVAVCHQNKKQGLSTLQKISGAGAFGQIARAVLVFSEDPADDELDDLRRKRLMIVAKMSGGRKNVGLAYRLQLPDGHTTPRLEWIAGERTINADDVGFRPSGGRDHQAKIGDAVDYLRKLLAAGPVKALEVHTAMDGAGFKRRQIDAAASTLGIEKRQTADRSWTWALPAGDAFEEFPEFGQFGLRE